MPKFKVEITETLRRVVEIEADDVFEAEDIVETMWCNSEVILNADDFDGVDFYAKEVTE